MLFGMVWTFKKKGTVFLLSQRVCARSLENDGGIQTFSRDNRPHARLMVGSSSGFRYLLNTRARLAVFSRGITGHRRHPSLGHSDH